MGGKRANTTYRVALPAHRLRTVCMWKRAYSLLVTDLHFVAAHFHCHAPTCVSQELRYGNETGELLCKETPYHGQGAEPSVDRFDEPGYIAQRVCLWGSPPLAPPPLVSGVKLWYKAVTNNTYGHHGEMALPQMLLASL